MTEEQFQALITMTRYIVDAAIAGNEFGGVDGSQHLAVRANRMADRMIDAARSLLVEKPAKEIRTFCDHGMLPGNCTAHGCKHWFRNVGSPLFDLSKHSTTCRIHDGAEYVCDCGVLRSNLINSKT